MQGHAAQIIMIITITIKVVITARIKKVCFPAHNELGICRESLLSAEQPVLCMHVCMHIKRHAWQQVLECMRQAIQWYTQRHCEFPGKLGTTSCYSICDLQLSILTCCSSDRNTSLPKTCMSLLSMYSLTVWCHMIKRSMYAQLLTSSKACM